jgi:hypothetical protein
MGSAIALYIGCGTCGFNGFVGKIRNNILVSTAPNRFGVYEDPKAGLTQHPVALENNLFFISNSGSGTGVLYRFYNGSTQTLLTDINQVNTLVSLIPTVVDANNIEGDPKVDSTYHLSTGSAAIDKATTTEEPTTDMDGEDRPKGSAGDIGPDEAQ